MPQNLSLPARGMSVPIDGKDYHFERFDVSTSPVDLLAAASTALGRPITHVEIEVVSTSTIRISLNGVPSNPTLGKTISQSLPWATRGLITSLSAIHTSGTDPAVVEVEYYTAE